MVAILRSPCGTSLSLDTICTIGHSTGPIDDLLNLLHTHRIQFILRAALPIVNPVSQGGYGKHLVDKYYPEALVSRTPRSAIAARESSRFCRSRARVECTVAVTDERNRPVCVGSTGLEF